MLLYLQRWDIGMEKVITSNQIIERHKVKHDNFWDGIYYSKTIGGLDYILFE